jgi:hypothetical protein
MARLEVLIPDVEEEEYESLRSALLETLPGDHSATTYYHRLEVHLEVDPVDNPTVFTKQLARKVASKAEKICGPPRSRRRRKYPVRPEVVRLGPMHVGIDLRSKRWSMW